MASWSLWGGGAGATQHCGHGRFLMQTAERYSAARGYTHVSVIVGVGTRCYYRHLGFVLVEGG